MAPEQLEDQPYSREIDIWALGAVVYWLCSTIDVRRVTADLPTLKVRPRRIYPCFLRTIGPS